MVRADDGLDDDEWLDRVEFYMLFFLFFKTAEHRLFLLSSLKKEHAMAKPSKLSFTL